MKKQTNKTFASLLHLYKSILRVKWVKLALFVIAAAIVLAGTVMATSYIVKQDQMDDQQPADDSSKSTRSENRKTETDTENDTKKESDPNPVVDSKPADSPPPQQSMNISPPKPTPKQPAANTHPKKTAPSPPTNPGYDAQGRALCGIYKTVTYKQSSVGYTPSITYGDTRRAPSNVWATFPDESISGALIVTGLCSDSFVDWTYGAGYGWCKYNEGNKWIPPEEVLDDYSYGSICKHTFYEKKQL